MAKLKPQNNLQKKKKYRKIIVNESPFSLRNFRFYTHRLRNLRKKAKNSNIQRINKQQPNINTITVHMRELTLNKHNNRPIIKKNENRDEACKEISNSIKKFLKSLLYTDYTKIKNLLIQSYKKILGNDEKALQRFEVKEETEDDKVIYGDIETVNNNINDAEDNVKMAENFTFPELLEHIFGFNNYVDDHVINENEGNFKEILNVFYNHFHLLCPSNKKTTYAERALYLCTNCDYETPRPKFKELKQQYETLFQSLKQIKQNNQQISLKKFNL